MKKALVLVLLLAACRSSSSEHEGWPSANGDALEVVPLKYASAPEAAEALNDLFNGTYRIQGKSSTYNATYNATTNAAVHTMAVAPGVFITSDARTNSLLLRTSPDQMPRLLELIGKMDVKVN